MIRTFHHGDYDAASLARRKGGQTVSVCLPARNEEATVGGIVATIIDALIDRVPLVDEVLVVDDHSTDDTAVVAAAAGAKVIDASSMLAEHALGPGKGKALWRSLAGSTGELVVWCDADITDFGPHFVVGLLGPLIDIPDISYVKGFYDRPLAPDGEGGGRVTELTARPILSLLHPELTQFVQPLSGEYAGRRSLLERVPFFGGYGVEIGLLIDIARRAGIAAMAQVDLGVRVHRNRRLLELGNQATTILQTALRRVDPDLVPDVARLIRADGEEVEITSPELPPLVTIADYPRRGWSSPT